VKPFLAAWDYRTLSRPGFTGFSLSPQFLQTPGIKSNPARVHFDFRHPSSFLMRRFFSPRFHHRPRGANMTKRMVAFFFPPFSLFYKLLFVRNFFSTDSCCPAPPLLAVRPFECVFELPVFFLIRPSWFDAEGFLGIRSRFWLRCIV